MTYSDHNGLQHDQLLVNVNALKTMCQAFKTAFPVYVCMWASGTVF